MGMDFPSVDDEVLSKQIAEIPIEEEKKRLEKERELQPPLKDLLPRGLSNGGFLEEGQTLEGVLARDKQALDLLGYTAQEVADFLGPIIELAKKGSDFNYLAPNKQAYRVTAFYFRGDQECPWKDSPKDGPEFGADMDEKAAWMNIYAKNEEGKVVAGFPGLLRHLIAKHGFFEGTKSYRLAPEDIVKHFGVEKNPGSIEAARKLQLPNSILKQGQEKLESKMRRL